MPFKCFALALPAVASLVFLFSPQAGAQDGKTTVSPGSSNKWAVVVGVSKFKDPNIKYPNGANNARAFADYLIKEAKFAPDHVKLLQDDKASRTGIMLTLGQDFLPRMVDPDSLVVVYLSSNGTPGSMDADGENYFCAYDTDLDNLFSSGVVLQNLQTMLRQRVPAKRILMVLDVPYGGAEDKSPFRQSAREDALNNADSAMIKLASSTSAQKSWDSAHCANGVFTKYLLEGLRTKASIKDAFTYAQGKVTAEVATERKEKQVPQYFAKPGDVDLKCATAGNAEHFGELINP